jgi:hypothetical protein
MTCGIVWAVCCAARGAGSTTLVTNKGAASRWRERRSFPTWFNFVVHKDQKSLGVDLPCVKRVRLAPCAPVCRGLRIPNSRATSEMVRPSCVHSSGDCLAVTSSTRA